MVMLDIFQNDIFSTVSLTSAINKAPHKPRLLGALNVFTEVGIRTDVAVIEERHGKLSLLNTAVRGTVNDVRAQDKRQARSFKVPHVPYFSTILAGDIQNIRAFGSETELKATAAEVNDRLVAMRDDHEVTHEFHRVSALKGVLYDGDNSTVIYNYFTEFDITQNTADFDYDESFSPVCSSVIRQIAGALGGTPFGQIYALCGNDYFDAVCAHTDVRTGYDRWRDGAMLRASQLGPEYYELAANGLMFQNIMFINYRGTIGNVTFIPDTEAYYFPTGVPELFQEIMAPPDFMEFANTKGRRLYAKQEPMRFNKGIELHTQSNVLAICTRPAAVIKSTVSNYPPS